MKKEGRPEGWPDKAKTKDLKNFFEYLNIGVRAMPGKFAQEGGLFKSIYEVTRAEIDFRKQKISRRTAVFALIVSIIIGGTTIAMRTIDYLERNDYSSISLKLDSASFKLDSLSPIELGLIFEKLDSNQLEPQGLKTQIQLVKDSMGGTLNLSLRYSRVNCSNDTLMN